VCQECDLVLVATSAALTRDAIRKAQPGPGNRIVLAGRSIEPATGEWLSEVVQKECNAVRVGALGGPAPVEEILNGGLCAGVVASPYQEICDLTTTALHSTRYRVYHSQDLVGVQLMSAAVPVLATLLGLASNLRGTGVGMHAMVLSRGLAEAARLAQASGAQESTLFGLAGVGDLVASHSTTGNVYFDAGASLAKGQVTDGPWHLANALIEQARVRSVELPLTEALVAMHGGEDPVSVVQRLMSRSATSEH